MPSFISTLISPIFSKIYFFAVPFNKSLVIDRGLLFSSIKWIMFAFKVKFVYDFKSSSLLTAKIVP